MHSVVYAVYFCIVGLIRIYKWLELQLLLLFNPIIKHYGTTLANSIGVTFQYPQEKDDNSTKKSSTEKYKLSVQLQVYDNQFFAKVANRALLAFGEAYMDKSIDFKHPEDLTEFATRILENNLVDLYYFKWNTFLDWLELYAFNLQTRKRAFEVGKVHYDLGNEMFELMLDPWMQYTCGYWKDTDNLNDAQIAKMELIAKKLDLKPGMRVLDIGCGWGTLVKWLAINKKVSCIGITISAEGVKYGKEICKGLPVEIRLQDYREVTEKFDRIVSVGMFEHVGYWNYREFFQTVRKCLKDDDSIFLLHTLGRNHYTYPMGNDPWIHKYIFPNGRIPSLLDVAQSSKNLFIVEDWHNFSLDYGKTLYCWRENFINNWAKIEKKYDETFYRMWICYLSLSRALFRSRRLQLWQIVLSKDGLKREYRAAR